MSMAIPGSFIDELLARVDIVDVVGSYVQLTKKSGSNMFGLCPFHSEKTPSFSVSSQKQIYHCFGCGKGGSAINFIMEIENLSFVDAVRFLARRENMTVPDDSESPETKSRRERMLALNRDAARFFYENLSKPEGKAALDYINKRKISKQSVINFGLGVAPDSWGALTDAMIAKGYSPADLFDAGLVKRGRNSGIYDTFRNRLMFPVIDVRGNVIGFSGRILGDGEPKYLNSADTLVFSKQRNLFGLNLAKKTKQNMLILVEGNIDVVSLHQAGFDCAVASLGTSLTEDQARLMSRYTDNVVIAYDSDGAGVKAAERAIGLLNKTGLSVKVLRMSGAKDPDEYIVKNGADGFRRLIEMSENHIEYRLLTVKNKYDLTVDEDRVKYLAEATELLSTLDNSVEREIYGARVAETAGVTPDAVKNEIRKAYAKKRAINRRKQERENLRPAIAAAKNVGIRYDDPLSASAEEGVVRLLVLDPTMSSLVRSLTPSDFTSPFLARVYEMVLTQYENGRNVSVAALASELKSEEAARLTEIMQKPEDMALREQAMRDYIDKIKTEKLRKGSDNNDLMALREKLREKKGYKG